MAEDNGKKELTREEEFEKKFESIERMKAEENAKQDYDVKEIVDLGEFIGEFLLRLGKAQAERDAFAKRYENFNNDILKIKEQEAITKSIAQQLYENNSASIIKDSIKYDFSLDKNKENISLTITDVERNIKLEEVEFPFKKYYLEKDDKEIDEKEIPKKENAEKEIPKEAKEVKETTVENPWEKKLEKEKSNSLDLDKADNPWDKPDKEVNSLELEETNPWTAKLEKDKSASKELDMGREI